MSKIKLELRWKFEGLVWKWKSRKSEGNKVETKANFQEKELKISVRNKIGIKIKIWGLSLEMKI